MVALVLNTSTSTAVVFNQDFVDVFADLKQDDMYVSAEVHLPLSPPPLTNVSRLAQQRT